MDQEQTLIDGQTPLQRKNQDPVSRFGILMGLFGGGYLISQITVAVLLIAGAGLNVIDPEAFSGAGDPKTIGYLKAGQFLAAIITFLVPAVVYKLIMREPVLPSLLLNRAFPPATVLIIAVCVLATMPLVAFVAELNAMLPLPEILLKMEKDAENLTRAFLRSDGPGDLFINMGVVAVTAAVAEEIFFRGSVQPILARWTKNIHWAIWLTALLFSVLHFQFLGLVPRLLLGALMGYMFYWTGSLWAPILAHFVNNGTGVLVNYLIQKGTLGEEIEHYGSSGSDWLGLLGGTLVMLACLMLLRKKPPLPVSD
ncbi:MAG: CPBP family intramembrane metalloprotease [Bacteroidia bacterium]|nr:CPBP family intramembrane metalloprotease [Bacteroidia bacterium]